MDLYGERSLLRQRGLPAPDGPGEDKEREREFSIFRTKRPRPLKMQTGAPGRQPSDIARHRAAKKGSDTIMPSPNGASCQSLYHSFPSPHQTCIADGYGMETLLNGPLMLGHNSTIRCGASAYGTSMEAACLLRSCSCPALHML